MATRKLIAVFAALSLALTACSGSAKTTSTPAISAAPSIDNRPVKSGGTLTVGLSADPDALDPSSSATLIGRVVFADMCQKLYDIDAAGTIVPRLASALPVVSPDGKTVTISLRQGIKFNDGTPLDAAAVKQTLDRDRTWKRSARRAELAAVSNVAVAGPGTVRLTLSRPYAPLTAVLADRSGMALSPAALAKLGDNFGTHPVCVGPFQFANRVSGTEIDLVRAPAFYDAAKVKLDKLVFKVMVDPNVRASNLEAGTTQAAEELAESTVTGVAAHQNLNVYSGGGLGYYGVQINIGNTHGSTAPPGPVSTALGRSPALREAFELSLDRTAINKVVYSGLNQPDCNPFPFGSPFRPSAVTCTSFDPAKGKQLVSQSGFKPPIPVALTVPNDAIDERLGQVIQQMARAAGFSVSVRPIEFATSLAQGASGAFDALLTGWSGRIDPDGDLTNLVTSGGALNYSGMSDPGIDGPVRAAAATGDIAQRRALYAQANAREAALRGYLYLYHQKFYLGVAKNLAGVQYYEDGLPRFEAAGFTAGS